MKLLAIDDNLDVLDIYRRIARKICPKHELSMFVSPIKAVEHAKKDMPDLVFCDYYMSIHNGEWVYNQLMDLGFKGKFAIVSASIPTIGDALARCPKAHAISKPFGVTDFRDML